MILTSCLILPLAGYFVIPLFLPAAIWQIQTVHVMMESLGLFSGIALALLILQVNKRENGDSYLEWVASALIVMGILDGFHSAVGTGSVAGWLHSLAMVGGSTLFAMIWLGTRRKISTYPFLIPAISAVAATVLGTIIIFFPYLLPPIIIPYTTTFTPTGAGVNILAGVFFFIAAAALFTDRCRGKSDKELFLAGFCILNGLAAILTIVSHAWSALFWYWHLLRVSAYILLFLLIYNIFREERLESEQELQESREKYRTLVETVKDWIWEVDKNGVYTYASPKIRDILGYEPGEIVGKSPVDLMPPDEAVHAAIELNAMLIERKPIVSMENTYLHKEGRLVILETSGLPFFSQTGEFSGYRGIDRDISERKHNEEELFQAHEALTSELEKRRIVQRDLDEERRLFIGGMTVVFKWRAENGWPVEYVSPNVEKQFGYMPFEFISGDRSFVSVIHPDDLERVAHEVRDHAKSSDTMFEQEFRIRRKDGLWRWLYVFTIIGRGKDGVVTHYNGYVLDITERKLAETRLIDSEGRYRKLFESSLDGLLVIDADTALITDANSAVGVLLGKTRDELVGRSLGEIGLFVDEASAIKAVLDMKNFRYLHYDDLLFNSPDGRRRRIEFIGNIYSFNEEPIIQFTIRDITYRVMAEETLRLNAERNATLLKLNQMTGISEKEVMQYAFDEGIRLTGSKVGYLATLNDDETFFTMQLCTQNAMEQCRVSEKPMICDLQTAGLWGEAVRQRRPVIINDYAAPHPLKKGVPEGHVHISRHMNVPVFSGSKIVLVAGVGNKEDEYNETDVQQLTLLMEGMWRIIERKRSEDLIEKARRHVDNTLKFIQTIISAIPTPIFYKDKEFRYLGVNEAFAEIMGFTPEYYIGKTVTELWPGEYAEVYHEKDLELMRTARKQVFEYKVLDKNGVDHPVIYGKNIFRNEHGEITGIVGAFIDITDRKKAEDELNEYREYLEEIVRKRTRELSETNEKLIQEISERIAVQQALNKRLVALTEPLETTEVRFSDLFDIDEIQKIQDAFADATHVASVITMPNGTLITKPSNFCRLCNDFIRKTENGHCNFLKSDAVYGVPNVEGPVIQPCQNGGLLNAETSVVVGGKHIANWLIGQVKNESIDEEKILDYARKIGADETEFRIALQEVLVMPMEQFEKVANILFLLANELSLKAYQNVQQARFITERRRAEEALTNSERRLAEIINRLPDATFVIDNSGTVISWNKAIEEMTGILSDTIIGKGNFEHAIVFYGIRRPLLADLVLMPDEENEQKYYPGIQKEGDILYAETEIPNLNGKRVTLWVKASPLYDNKGSRVGAIESIRDITEQKGIENAIVEAKEKAEIANQAKSIFLSRMSHELRTPLNAILGFLQIFRRQPNVSKAQKRQIDIMLGSGEHLLGLINDLLDVGKIEEQRIELENTPFNLSNAIRQVLSVSRFRTDEKGLSLQQKIVQPLPEYVLGDERRFRQIVLNLLSNAVKFTDKGTVILQVRYDRIRSVICIDVIDTGIGIPDEMHSAIFDPFRQLAESGRVSEGTGLGLTITRQLVVIMGGTITLESEQGKGSTFHVEIPMQEAGSLLTERERKNESISGYFGLRRSILIIDDDQAHLSMLLSALEPLGFVVTATDSGSEAIMMVKRQRPDLLLLDLIMPDMDGLAIIKELKNEPGFNKCRIIGVSAEVSPGSRKDEFIASCDDFISKPVNIDLLLEKIRIILDITWETAGPDTGIISPWQGEMANGKIPPDSLLLAMQQAAGIGDYDTLEHLLDNLEKEDPAYGMFCSRMRTYIDLYDEEGIISSISRLREQHDETH